MTFYQAAKSTDSERAELTGRENEVITFSKCQVSQTGWALLFRINCTLNKSSSALFSCFKYHSLFVSFLPILSLPPCLNFLFFSLTTELGNLTNLCICVYVHTTWGQRNWQRESKLRKINMSWRSKNWQVIWQKRKYQNRWNPNYRDQHKLMYSKLILVHNLD